MNDTPQDAWFYTREGERMGPVTLADLRIKVAESSINPRLDMVWKHGMAEWKPAGEIEGLFERRASLETEVALAPPPAESYQAPKPQPPVSTGGDWPGARRRSFIAIVLIFPVLWRFGFITATPLLTAELGPEIMKFAAIGAILIPIIIGLSFGLERLVNLGMSRWWSLAILVPLLNCWVSYRCFVCPAGYAYHKKLDGAGIFLAIIYWLMLVIALLVVAAIVAAMAGAVGSPEIRQQIQEMIRTMDATKP